MATKRRSGKVDLDRRAVLMLGLAGASAPVLGKGGNVLGAEAKGVDIKVLKEAESMVPGFPKVRLREFTFEPGGRTEGRKMPNAMICECSLGALEVTQEGKTWTVKKGDIWTCKERPDAAFERRYHAAYLFLLWYGQKKARAGKGVGSLFLTLRTADEAASEPSRWGHSGHRIPH